MWVFFSLVVFFQFFKVVFIRSLCFWRFFVGQGCFVILEGGIGRVFFLIFKFCLWVLGSYRFGIRRGFRVEIKFGISGLLWYTGFGVSQVVRFSFCREIGQEIDQGFVGFFFFSSGRVGKVEQDEVFEIFRRQYILVSLCLFVFLRMMVMFVYEFVFCFRYRNYVFNYLDRLVKGVLGWEGLFCRQRFRGVGWQEVCQRFL